MTEAIYSLVSGHWVLSSPHRQLCPSGASQWMHYVLYIRLRTVLYDVR